MLAEREQAFGKLNDRIEERVRQRRARSTAVQALKRQTSALGTRDVGARDSRRAIRIAQGARPRGSGGGGGEGTRG
jgi:hypothetical protein